MTIAIFLLSGVWPNILFIVLGTPLAKGTVPPNSAYGYRTRRSRSSPEMWTAMNKVAGKIIMLGGNVISDGEYFALGIATRQHKYKISDFSRNHAPYDCCNDHPADESGTRPRG